VRVQRPVEKGGKVPAACSKLQGAREREMLLTGGALEWDVHHRRGGPVEGRTTRLLAGRARGRGTDLTDREAAVGRT
jgi:hypothetical protein